MVSCEPTVCNLHGFNIIQIVLELSYQYLPINRQTVYVYKQAYTLRPPHTERNIIMSVAMGLIRVL